MGIYNPFEIEFSAFDALFQNWQNFRWMSRINHHSIFAIFITQYIRIVVAAPRPYTQSV
jgi:hypothetical protein